MKNKPSSLNRAKKDNQEELEYLCLGGKKEEDSVALNSSLIQRTTKVYDSALGIKPPEEQKNLQQRAFNWVPDGIWKINGKLDPNFVDWLAKDWMKSFGGDFHRKRADVLRHFKKDPANIAPSLTGSEADRLGAI